jgi:hypothetical protein
VSAWYENVPTFTDSTDVERGPSGVAMS